MTFSQVDVSFFLVAMKTFPVNSGHENTEPKLSITVCLKSVQSSPSLMCLDVCWMGFVVIESTGFLSIDTGMSQLELNSRVLSEVKREIWTETNRSSS